MRDDRNEQRPTDSTAVAIERTSHGRKRSRVPLPRTGPASEALDRIGRLLSLAEAAELLGLSKRTLERMVVRRELNVLRVGHGRGTLRVAEAEVLRLINEGQERA